MTKLLTLLTLLPALLFAMPLQAHTTGSYDEITAPGNTNPNLHLNYDGPSHWHMDSGALGEGALIGVHSNDPVHEPYVHARYATWSRDGDACGYHYFLSNYHFPISGVDNVSDAGNIEFAITCGFRNATGGNHVNYGQISGSGTGLPIILSTQGSDADVGLSLVPKGAGHVFAPNGYFGVNTNPATSTVTIFTPTGTGNGINFKNASNTGTSYNVSVYDASNNWQGSLVTTTASHMQISNPSDYRLKKNVQNVTGALDRVMKIRPVTFDWKANGLPSEGFIAHELQAIEPAAVIGQKDAVDLNGKPKYQGVSQDALVPELTAAIQELKAANDNLEARLKKLESR